MRKDFWDRHGANIAKKNSVARGYFDVLKTILDRDNRFYAAVLSEMDLVILIQGKRKFDICLIHREALTVLCSAVKEAARVRRECKEKHGM